MKFTIIAAMDPNRGIGKDNKMPWHLSADLKHFKETTLGGTVIMGRKTWEGIPEKFKPFSGRTNVVMTRQSDFQVPEGVLMASSLDEALKLGDERLFVIGGAGVYEQAIQHPDCERLILTQLENTFDCDAFFPKIPTPDTFKIVSEGERMEENGISFRYVTFERA